MKIVVCIKQVPDTETKIKISSDGKSIDTNGIKWVVNPYDEFAIEEAVKIKEANAGAQVHVYCVGPKKRTIDAVRTALAMGADEGLLIDAPENTEPKLVAEALCRAITAEGGAQLILGGKLAIDDNASSVPQMLAEALGVPHSSVVSKLSFTPAQTVAERDVDGGAKEIVQMLGTSVIAANKGLNLPRYASLPGIMKAKKKVLKELDFASLGVSDKEQTRTLSLELPPEKAAAQLIAGDAASQATKLVQLLRDEAKVL